MCCNRLDQGCQNLLGKGPHPSLCVGSRAATLTIIITSGIANRLNYCVVCIVQTFITKVAAGRGLHTSGA